MSHRKETLFSTRKRPLDWFRGKKVTVMGLGLFGGGRGVTEFLCHRKADVTVTDLRTAETLEPSLKSLMHLPIRWVLGEHREKDFLQADLVIPSPAVPRHAPLLQLCRKHGVPLETEMNLFFKYCPGRICAVSGSNGKTTTTRLVGEMARRRWPDVRVGGNLGHSLLPAVEKIHRGEWVILELSSFQLEDLRAVDRRPEISVLTHLAPNHLDRHGTYEAYLEAKREILCGGPPPNIAVVCAEDAILRSWAGDPSRRTLYFGRVNNVVPTAPGVWIHEERGEVFWSSRGVSRLLFRADDLQLRGRFNLINAAAAAAAATAVGLGGDEIQRAIRDFRPLEHRLEFFLKKGDIEYFDDSIATTSESTIAALEALGPRVVLISGGASKGCPFTRLAEIARLRAKAICLIGQTAAEMETALRAGRHCPPVHRSGTLEAAVAEARKVAEPGDRVLLSPACPSYDQFINFEDRGRRFKQLVRQESENR